MVRVSGGHDGRRVTSKVCYVWSLPIVIGRVGGDRRAEWGAAKNDGRHVIRDYYMIECGNVGFL